MTAQFGRTRPRHPAIAQLARWLGRLPTLLTSGGLLASGILTSIITSRALGASGRGEYITWQAWAAAIAIFAVGGLPQAIVLDRRGTERHRFSELCLALSVTVAAGALALGVPLAIRRPDHLVVLGALLIVGANQFAAVTIAEAQRMGRMTGEFNVARSMAQAASLAAMGLLLVTGSAGVTVWLVTVAACQAAAVILWAAAVAGRGRPAPDRVRGLIRDGVRLAPGNWATLTQYRLDLLAVAMLFPPATVAFYAVGTAAQMAVLAAGQSGGMHWFARRGEDLDNRHAQLRAEIVKTTGLALGVALVIAASSWVWVPRLYGGAFSPSIPVVVALCGVGVLQSLDYLLNHECLLSGRGRRLTRYRAPALVLLLCGFGLVKLAGWPVVTAALLAGLGYAVSVGMLLTEQRAAVGEAAASGEGNSVTSGEVRVPTPLDGQSVEPSPR